MVVVEVGLLLVDVVEVFDDVELEEVVDVVEVIQEQITEVGLMMFALALEVIINTANINKNFLIIFKIFFL